MKMLADATPQEIQTALTLGGVLAILAYVLHAVKRPKRLENMPENPRKVHSLGTGYPLLGDLVERIANGDRLYHWLDENARRFNGEPWKFAIPGVGDVVVFTMPEAIEEITAKQFDIFPKGEYQIDSITDMLGAGVVASDGARWFHQRKAAVKFFSAKTLRALMTDSMQKNMTKVCHVIDGKMAQGKQVDLKQLFMEFTMDTFAELGMGVDLKCIGAANPHPFQHALDVIAPVTARRFRLPAWLWRTERWLNIGPEAELRKHRKIVEKWLHEVIQESLENAQQKKGANSDIKSVVQLFVEQANEETEGGSANDLADFLLTFVIAARDTTADTLCWLFYRLGQHPEVAQKIWDEMNEKLPSDHKGYLASDDIKSLVYLEAAIKETIRLYPAAPFTMRQCIQDTVICGETVLGKGQLIGMSAYATSRNPRVWGPDAVEFKPERWIDPTSGEILQASLFKYFSFSAGPRTCLGMKLAMLELRIVTANLLRRYSFDIDQRNDGMYEVAPTLTMLHPLLATVQLRD